MSHRTLRAGLLALAPLISLTVAGCDKNQPDVPSDIALRQFANCGQLRSYAEDAVLEQLIQARYGYWYAMEDGAPNAEGDTLLGGWLGPALAVGVTGALRGRLALEAATEVGYVAVPVTAQAAGRPAAAIAGPFWGLHLGAGLFP